MAVNRRLSSEDISRDIKTNPGPYIGYVKNPTDINRMGRLFVHIPDLHGDFREETIRAQTVSVSYCSPFAGQTPLTETNTNREFANTQKSYGFWMVPPDVDTKVLVMFANGDINSGYWLGCIYEDLMNHMTPGIATSEKFSGSDGQLTRYVRQQGLDTVPVAEPQRFDGDTSGVQRDNNDPRTDNSYPFRPTHVPATETLIAQGLIRDEIRGTTSSSARRETPSQVFGISTPGPIDYEGQKTNRRESINRHGKIYKDSGDEFDFSNVAHSRLGGQTFVMDDGTPAIREGNTTKTPIQNELIRLRTRSGAQLLLHNSEELVYITNNNGSAWIEFTADGKIDVYAKDSVSFHTANDFNFRADRDINMEAARNINIKATGENTKTNSDPSLTTGRIHIDAANNYELVIGVDGLIKAGANIKTFAGTDFNVNTDNEIHFNTAGKVSSSVTASLNTFDNVGLNEQSSKSIMKRVPTAEPYNEHENKRKDKTTTTMTDREQPDERFEG